jgi:hypothetical protein
MIAVRVDLPWLKEPPGMPFIKRDADGRIVALSADPPESGADNVFYFEGNREAAHDLNDALRVLTEWLQSDLAMMRVLEDLIDVLIDNGTIRFDQLPQNAQEKILQRRGLRRELRYVQTLFSGNEAELVSADEADENERYL